MALVNIEMNKHGVARATLNRPDVHNAINDVLIRELTDCIHMLGRHANVRTILLTGAGKSFSAGADLAYMQRAADQGEAENRADALNIARLFNELSTCPKPIVALVNGAALGGGTGLVACCDIAIAHPKAVFGLTEVRLGIIPATISPYVVAKISQGQARRYMLTGERFGAEEARRIGLVHEVSDDLEGTAKTIVDAICLGGPEAIADTKRLIAEVAGQPVTPELTAMTADRIATRRASAEAREGMSAFLDKRKPGWTE